MSNLLVGISAWLVVSIVLAIWLRSKFSHRVANLGYVFIGYIWMIGCFSHIYHYVYLRDRSTFVFATDVFETRKTDVLADMNQQLSELQLKLQAIDGVNDRLKQGQAEITIDPRNDNWVSLDTEQFKYLFDIGMWAKGDDERLVQINTLQIMDRNGKDFGVELVNLKGPSLLTQRTSTPEEWNRLVALYFPPKKPDMYQEMLDDLKTRLEKRLNDLTYDIGEGNTRITYWGYLDFLYFSTTTQTTIGFGDILPNRSRVRLIVTIQVLLGLLLLAIVINILVGTGPLLRSDEAL